jgi:hypothetical protein
MKHHLSNQIKSKFTLNLKTATTSGGLQRRRRRRRRRMFSADLVENQIITTALSGKQKS